MKRKRSENLLPTVKEKRKALGLKETPKQFEAGDFFPEVPLPTDDNDWLAQYDPEKQSFSQWERVMRKKIKRWKENNMNTIYLVRIGEFKVNSSPSLAALEEYCQAFYHPFKVKWLEHLEILKEKRRTKDVYFVQIHQGCEFLLKHRRCHRYDDAHTPAKHRQFAVDPILSILYQIKPQDALCLVGITMEDLYEGKTDSFSVGMAAGGDAVALFSFARYDPYFNAVHNSLSSSPSPTERQTALLSRSCKVLVHEIGHLFGIEHCCYYACVMNGSGHLEEDYKQPHHLCPIDLRKVLHLTGATAEVYYQLLLEFYTKHHFEEEIAWVSGRLRFIL